jgi:hypothetical protein
MLAGTVRQLRANCRLFAIVFARRLKQRLANSRILETDKEKRTVSRHTRANEDATAVVVDDEVPDFSSLFDDFLVDFEPLITPN